MSDIFTLKTVSITPELAMIFKSFRVENKVTAKSIVDKFGKSSTYITKLEKGDIKKIDSNFLVDLCNFISHDNGLIDFLRKSSLKFETFTTETQNIIQNIDDLVLEHQVTQALISDINKYMTENVISTESLFNEINSNSDLSNINTVVLDKLPNNIWCLIPDEDRVVIKLSIPQEYLINFLSGNINIAHSVIIEAILYTLYKLGNEDNPDKLALSRLHFYGIDKYRNVITLNDSNMEDFLEGLDPKTKNQLRNITNSLNVIAKLTKEIGSSRIEKIAANMQQDISFYFAYMSYDLTELEKQPKNVKQQFLKDLKTLIQEHLKPAEPNIDLYIDEV